MDDGRPLLTFPDRYSIKAVGKDKQDFAEYVKGVVADALTDSDSVSYKTRNSSKGVYISVTLDFVAQTQEELDKVFSTVHSDSRVLWVL